MEKICQTASSNRVVWLDFLKVIAVFMMLAVHCTDNVTPAERFEPWYNVWGSLYGSLLRPAIPLFVMVTGALLLPVRQDARSFYGKRLMRIVIPFVFWSVLYNLFPWFTGVLGLDPSVIHDFFVWADSSQSLGDALYRIVMIPFTFSPFAIQMWYVYVLIGLYLYMPVFSAWVSRASRREQQFFLGIWAVTLFIPYLREYLTADLWGSCSWNEFNMLYYFAGFNGYLLLGHYLVKYPVRIGRIQGLLGAVLFILGYGITYFGFKTVTSIPGQPVELVELFYTYCSPNVLLMTLPVFVGAQNLNFSGNCLPRLLRSLSTCTLGIWMCHYLFLGPCFMLIEAWSVHTLLKMFITSCLLLVLTWLFVALVRRLGNYGRWIMG